MHAGGRPGKEQDPSCDKELVEERGLGRGKGSDPLGRSLLPGETTSIIATTLPSSWRIAMRLAFLA
jgi:hypothetical protein